MTEKEREHLTSASFKEKVFNYENKSEWEYRGTIPCIIDFYADWSGPCRMLDPVLDELSREYDGKAVFYRVNVETEQELASLFGITGLPGILIIPLNGKPGMAAGALHKDILDIAIKEVLKIT